MDAVAERSPHCLDQEKEIQIERQEKVERVEPVAPASCTVRTARMVLVEARSISGGWGRSWYVSLVLGDEPDEGMVFSRTETWRTLG